MMHVLEADREGVDWNKYDLVICGAPVLYGVFRKQFLVCHHFLTAGREQHRCAECSGN